MSPTFADKVNKAISFYQTELVDSLSENAQGRYVSPVSVANNIRKFANELVTIGYVQAMGTDKLDVIMETHKANHVLSKTLMSILPFVPESARDEVADTIRKMGSSATDLTPYVLPLITENKNYSRRFAKDELKAVDVIGNKLSIGLSADGGMLTTFPSLSITANGNLNYHVLVGVIDHEIFQEVRNSVYKLPKNETLLTPPRPLSGETDMEYYNPNPETAYGFVADWFVDDLTRMIYADIIITNPELKASLISEPNGLTSIYLKPRFDRDANKIKRCILLEVIGFGETVATLHTKLEGYMETARISALGNTPDDAPKIVQLTDKEYSPFYGYGRVEVSEGVNPMHRLYASPHFINGHPVAKVVQVLTPKGDVHGQIRFDTDPVTRKLTVDGLLAMVQFAITDNPDISDSVGDEAKLLIKQLSDMT